MISGTYIHQSKMGTPIRFYYTRFEKYATLNNNNMYKSRRVLALLLYDGYSRSRKRRVMGLQMTSQ
jgi:hypothetical protein